MTQLTRNEAAAWLKTRDRFCILTHRRPDGDTVGSGAALCRGLRQLGKKAWVLENPEVTEKYAPFLAELCKPAWEEGDVLVCVDVASSNMLPEAFAHLEEKIALRIDHHRGAESFTELEMVDPAAAACGQIIYDILAEMGVKLDVPMANALYTAIATDTGCFRYHNTQPHTFEVAAKCAAVSSELFNLNQMLFETNSFARLKIQSWMTENARFYGEGQICICALPLEVEKEIGVTEDDMENISGFPRTIAGVKIAATLRQQNDGIVKLSVRAVPGYDASAVCAKFGGGGHRGAAGASINLPLEEAAAAVLAAMPEI